MAPYLRYTVESMKMAMDAVKSGMSLKKSSRIHKVPEATLRKKIHNNLSSSLRKMGRNSYLTEDEENLIVQWVKEQCVKGVPPNRKDIMDSAQQIVLRTGRKTPFRNGRPGKSWFKAFLKRNSNIFILKGGSLENNEIFPGLKKSAIVYLGEMKKSEEQGECSTEVGPYTSTNVEDFPEDGRITIVKVENSIEDGPITIAKVENSTEGGPCISTKVGRTCRQRRISCCETPTSVTALEEVTFRPVRIPVSLSSSRLMNKRSRTTSRVSTTSTSKKRVGSVKKSRMANLIKASRSVGKLSPNSSILFLCDMQEKFSKTIKYFPEIVQVSNRMLKAFKIFSAPIVCTEQYPKGLGTTVPELEIKENDITPIDKTQFSMCLPPIETLLHDKNVSSVILCGIEAHVCIQNTALDLLEKGLDVHVVVDAISSRSMTDRMFAFQRMQQAGAFLTTSESVILALAGGSHHPKFKELQKLIMSSAPDTGLLHPSSMNIC